jgi:AraC family transcriptional activator of mtrCDE
MALRISDMAGRIKPGSQMQTDSADPLSQLAPLLRVRPEIQELCQFGGPWASPHHADRVAQFHLVLRGECVLVLKGHRPVHLSAGDILLLPHGQAHLVRSSDLEAASGRPIVERRQTPLKVKSNTDEPPDTELVCGVLNFEAGDFPLEVLPDIIVRRGDGDRDAFVQSQLIEAMHAELAALRPGGLAISTDLASALLVMLVRGHLESAPPVRGILALLGHKSAARATAAMIRAPARDWTLDALASEAAMSRASLVRLFQRLAGTAPMAFLADLRLGLARRRLAGSTEPIARIASALGYASEATFSRAVLRRFGARPGALRASDRLQGQPGSPT